MPVGFHDDATFRWGAGEAAALTSASAANASVIRTIANWRSISPQEPRQATDSFDRAYRFSSLDDLVRNAQRNGLQVMITIWGTPRWANESQGPNVAPTRPSDLEAFGRAIADRYSGRHPGFPHVGRYSIWNEPNLEIFLTPQFGRSGEIVSPRSYARLYRAGHAGIKAGNASALVAIGETSNQGRDRPLRGAADSVAPGTFARILAQERHLPFDAYATHPYPTRPNALPTEKVRWPNVTLSQLPRFERSLNRWFKRSEIPIWITEYGYQTKPGDRFGVTEAQQARYLSLVMNQLKADPRVQLFIWFIFRDSTRGLWQSGLTTESGRAKPAYATFQALAQSMGGQVVKIAPGIKPTIKLPVPRLAFVSPAGSTIGVTYRVFRGTQMVAMGQPAPRLQINQSVSFVASFTPAPRHRYRIEIDAGDLSGNHVLATYNLLTTAEPGTGIRTLSDSASCKSSPRMPGPTKQSQRC
ncbi:MAG: cellulase family glycosylhydrolase [Thermoleophilia bacterium]|nr:cellulase family glycosylhydrolase [Thermoleophilia bacterium]